MEKITKLEYIPCPLFSADKDVPEIDK